MNKEKLASIHNSGESLEKNISLLYTTLEKNYEFYDNYDIYVFYGNNLPKKSELLAAHGTIAFYEKYFSNEAWCPPCSPNYLWQIKNDFLQRLITLKVISNRAAEKLSQNYNLYWYVISRLPMKLLYPDFIDTILTKSKNILNVNFLNLNLEENYKSVYETITKLKEAYSIYALELNGGIGMFDMYLDEDYRYKKRLEHLYKELSRRPILSGNSAMLLAAINYLIDENYIVGYRNHKYSRKNRDIAMQSILENKQSVIEPKNLIYNNYYDKIKEEMDIEAKSNEVVAMVYKDYINSNIRSLKL